MPQALGLVETRGLVAAIEAADAMVKTSNVTLIGKEITRAALVTIKIVGDVAAVKASVDAGAAAASKIGELVSIHVIPQPDSQMVSLIPEITDDDVLRPKPVKKAEKPEGKKTETVKPAVEEKTQSLETEKKSVTKIEKTEEKEPPKSGAGDAKKSSGSDNIFAGTTEHLEKLRREALGIKDEKEKSETETRPVKTTKIPSMDELEKMNVHQLRKQARATERFPIRGREISRANRNELLDYFKKLI